MFTLYTRKYRNHSAAEQYQVTTVEDSTSKSMWLEHTDVRESNNEE